MENLIFCRDGVLRQDAKAFDPDEKAYKGRPVPLLGWQEAVDPHAFLKALHAPIRFEEGLTVLGLFENLAPWADQMTGIACMDFPAFLAEARRAPTGEDMSDLSHIELFWRAEISPVPAFTKPRETNTRDPNGMRVFNVGRPKETGRIYLQSHWDMSVRLTEKGRANYGGSESVSLSFSPISDWAHLELRILKEGYLSDATGLKSSRVFMGTDARLINPEHPLATAQAQSDRSPLVMACDPPTPTFFGALVRGLLWEIGFDYSPAQRDEKGEELRESMAEVTAALEGEAVPSQEAPAGTSLFDLDRRATFAAEMRNIEAAEAAAARLGAVRPDRIN